MAARTFSPSRDASTKICRPLTGSLSTRRARGSSVSTLQPRYVFDPTALKHGFKVHCTVGDLSALGGFRVRSGRGLSALPEHIGLSAPPSRWNPPRPAFGQGTSVGSRPCRPCQERVAKEPAWSAPRPSGPAHRRLRILLDPAVIATFVVVAGVTAFCHRPVASWTHLRTEHGCRRGYVRATSSPSTTSSTTCSHTACWRAGIPVVRRLPPLCLLLPAPGVVRRRHLAGHLLRGRLQDCHRPRHRLPAARGVGLRPPRRLRPVPCPPSCPPRRCRSFSTSPLQHTAVTYTWNIRRRHDRLDPRRGVLVQPRPHPRAAVPRRLRLRPADRPLPLARRPAFRPDAAVPCHPRSLCRRGSSDHHRRPLGTARHVDPRRRRRAWRPRRGVLAAAVRRLPRLLLVDELRPGRRRLRPAFPRQRRAGGAVDRRGRASWSPSGGVSGSRSPSPRWPGRASPCSAGSRRGSSYNGRWLPVLVPHDGACSPPTPSASSGAPPSRPSAGAGSNAAFTGLVRRGPRPSGSSPAGSGALSFSTPPYRPDQNPVGGWAQWNYSGYQAKPGWPEFSRVVAMLEQAAAVTRLRTARLRVRADSPRTPSGRPLAPMSIPALDERLHRQLPRASTTSRRHRTISTSSTRPSSSLQASNPVVGLPYRSLDVADGIRHLQLTGVKYFLADSPTVEAAAARDPAARGGRLDARVGRRCRRSLSLCEPALGPLPHPRTRHSSCRSVTNRSSRVGLTETQWQWTTAITWYQNPRCYWPVPIVAGGPASWPHAKPGTLLLPAASRRVPPTTVSHIVYTDSTISSGSAASACRSS